MSRTKTMRSAYKKATAILIITEQDAHGRSSAQESQSNFSENPLLYSSQNESRRFRQPIFQEGVSDSLVSKTNSDPFLKD